MKIHFIESYRLELSHNEEGYLILSQLGNEVWLTKTQADNLAMHIREFSPLLSDYVRTEE